MGSVQRDMCASFSYLYLVPVASFGLTEPCLNRFGIELYRIIEDCFNVDCLAFIHSQHVPGIITCYYYLLCILMKTISYPLGDTTIFCTLARFNKTTLDPTREKCFFLCSSQALSPKSIEPFFNYFIYVGIRRDVCFIILPTLFLRLPEFLHSKVSQESFS